MKNLSDLIPLCHVDLPQVPQASILQAAFHTYLDFTTKSRAYQKEYKLTLYSDQSYYALSDAMSDDGVVNEIECIRLPNAEKLASNLYSVALDYEEAPEGACMLYIPGLDTSYDELEVTVYVSLIPMSSTSQIPDLLFFRNQVTLAAGIKSRLQAQVHMPWGNGGMAAYNANEYNIGVSRAKRMMMRNMKLHSPGISI